MNELYYKYSTNIFGSEFITLKLKADIQQIIKVKGHLYEIIDIENEHLFVASYTQSLTKEVKVKSVNPVIYG